MNLPNHSSNSVNSSPKDAYCTGGTSPPPLPPEVEAAVDAMVAAGRWSFEAALEAALAALAKEHALKAAVARLDALIGGDSDLEAAVDRALAGGPK